MSVLGKIVGQLESGGSSSNVMTDYMDGIYIADYTLPPNSVFTVQKEWNPNCGCYGCLKIDGTTNVSMKINGVVPEDIAHETGDFNSAMIQVAEPLCTYVIAYKSGIADGSPETYSGTMKITEIKIDGKSYPDETIEFTNTYPMASDMLMTAKAVKQYIDAVNS